MQVPYTLHGAQRAQQRGVPRLITAWLLDYGAEQFDGQGAVIRYFSKDSVRRMERELGSAAVRRLSEYLRCYLVQSNEDGKVITIGKRYPNKRFWRH